MARDLADKGFQVSFPFGENADYDLVVDRGGRLERVQVKYADSGGTRLEVRCRSQSLTGGKVIRTRRYTTATIDWLAVFDAHSGDCFYIPATELGSGMSTITLRLAAARNNQRARIRHAADYAELE